jgi:hypothetical protein
VHRSVLNRVVVAGLIGGLLGCSGDDITGATAGAELLSIVPVGGAVDVDPNEPVTIQFTHPMGWGMEQYVALHEGDISRPAVAGTWTWSEDRTSLTFTPDEPLKAQTQYTVHIGGGLMDGAGNLLDCRRGEQFGGQWVTSGMMGGMGSMSGSMTGYGWRHPGNENYGMVFSFTTA